MKNQVLSIEQMKHLKELGIDTSKASMKWIYPECSHIIGGNGEYELEINSFNVFDDDIPTFTLQNILEILPKAIWVRDTYEYEFMLTGSFLAYGDVNNNLWFKEISILINDLYELLCWCAKNNRLNK